VSNDGLWQKLDRKGGQLTQPALAHGRASDTPPDALQSFSDFARL